MFFSQPLRTYYLRKQVQNARCFNTYYIVNLEPFSRSRGSILYNQIRNVRENVKYRVLSFQKYFSIEADQNLLLIFSYKNKNVSRISSIQNFAKCKYSYLLTYSKNLWSVDRSARLAEYLSLGTVLYRILISLITIARTMSE